MKRSTRGLAALIATATTITVLGVGCGDSPFNPEPDQIEELPRELSLAEMDLLTASNSFAFDFLNEVYRAEEGDFVFLSPLSVSMALGMTLNGADGSTLEGIRSTLRLADLTDAEINQAYQSLIELLEELDPNVTFGIGNSLWYREGFQLETPFIDALRDYFDARVQALDFSDPGAAGTINDWVHQATDGMIEEIVDSPIEPMTMAFLINAIFFDGTWTFTFDPSNTRPGLFSRADGTTEPVTLMELTEHLQYAETDTYQAVDLPYGGNAFSMTILLPKDPAGLGALVEDMDADEWDYALQQLHEKEVRLKLPRFELEYDVGLNGVLSAMGMADAFDQNRADFSRMHRDALDLQLHVSRVKHKTFVEVDEAGTRAAGVTSVEITVTAMPDRVYFEVNRPFLFAIRERFSGTILFVGAVESFE